MLSRIANLESLMAKLGHARPPITTQDFLDIKKAIATLKAQPVGPPIPVGDYIEARAAKSDLTKIASKCVENKQALPLWVALLYIELTRLAQSVSDWQPSMR